MVVYIVYIIINKLTNECYIGSTKRVLKKRIWEHFYKSKTQLSNSKLCRAIRKYDNVNFTWNILCTCSSLDELEVKENEYIFKYDAIKCGYNMRKSGINKKNKIKIKFFYKTIPSRFL